MLKKIIDFIKENWMKTPLAAKLSVILLVLSVFALLILLFGCQSVDQKFSERMYQRAELHFPRYQVLLDKAEPETLGLILSQDLSKMSPEQIKEIKSALIMEVKAWFIPIKKQYEVSLPK